MTDKSFEDTKYWNKPFGVKHWLEHKFGYKNEGDVSTPFDDDIIVLVDPDMLMQRPFLNDFSGFPNTLWHKTIRDGSKTPLYNKVSHGHPIAQTYSFTDSWLRALNKGNITEIVGPDSPVLTVSNHDAQVTFSAGPPYILTARDMYRLSVEWAKFTPLIQENFSDMMAEMYGYCTAAAHLNLRHQIAQGFMISNIDMSDGEGWDFLKRNKDKHDEPPRDTCDVEKFRDAVPHVIHFCQKYSIGEYFLSKYKVPVGILACDHALLELPPLNIASTTNYSHYGNDSVEQWGNNQQSIDRNTFMICSLLPALNKAATFFKDHHCPLGANYEETWNHFREGELQGCEKNDPGGCPV
eukprot:CAMPEP_0198256776 /NCGR_PEP_ID=MMETSP1447-20131203/6595_1 /TAXON_ID=420782 /ORGANISM="Chaetoceros dichaeta, Strain CCMP1751" /LENGTH=351 /DNA_ID=CAMNT_0043943487 /DNA_START=14 /DNA_END=1069 /DNA_ORIENTATION=-